MEHTSNQEITPAKGSTKTYIIGFVLATLLTLVSFSLVMIKDINRHVAFASLMVAALAQMVVHLHYFLHLDRSSSKRWNVMVLAFTAVIVFILIGGTLWVMFTLNSRMM
jgi:cytochrome o ubiquinol oxidase operon protein cyoD